jgi:hypothetical protein
MKYWIIHVGGTHRVIRACAVETAVRSAILYEKRRLKDRGKEIGKKLTMSKELKIFTEETTKAYFDECVKADKTKEGEANG